jgi:hypothetical protein
LTRPSPKGFIPKESESIACLLMGMDSLYSHLLMKRLKDRQRFAYQKMEASVGMT